LTRSIFKDSFTDSDSFFNFAFFPCLPNRFFVAFDNFTLSNSFSSPLSETVIVFNAETEGEEEEDEDEEDEEEEEEKGEKEGV